MVSSSGSSPVIIRIDDFQDYWINAVQTALLNASESKNVPVVAGCIMSALGTLGDVTVVNALKTALGSGLVELGVHGWKHDDYSNSGLYPLNQQVYDFQRGNNQMYKNFGVKTRLFMPPMNKFDSDTLLALQTDNYSIFSAGTDTDPGTSGYTPLFPHSSGDSYGLTHAPWTVLISSWNSQTQSYVMRPLADILASVQTSITTYGYAVIATHIQEFAVYTSGQAQNTVDQNKLTEYGQMIDSLNPNTTSGVNTYITTFGGMTGQKVMILNNIIVG